MTGTEQETIAFLSDPATLGTAGAVDVVETHISRIFLGSDRVLKMKRPVRLPYVDFSTPELRLAACRREVELNSLTAPGLYIAARRITCDADGTLRLEGEGELVDAVVEMRRFDQATLLDRMAVAGALTPAVMTETARAIARFHRQAPVARGKSGTAAMASVLEVNEAGFAQSGFFDPAEIARLSAAFRRELAKSSSALDRRSEAEKIRRCHGDLHLRNICVIAGKPTLFDCIEFNDDIATIDVLYDLAFLLMDLWHRDLQDLANLTANRYFDEADDEDGFQLLRFFMAVRAAVRAHVTGTQIAEGAGDDALKAEARAYLDLATGLLDDEPSRFVVIGGFSGSGKTTVAEALAAHVGSPPGARILESDRIRKSLFGVPAETRLPDKAYSPDVSSKVYRELCRRACLVLAEGGSVVADALFDRPELRAAIAAVSHDPAPSCFWLETESEILRKRVATRSSGPSDATVDVLDRQLQRKAPAAGWTALDAARPPQDIVADILARLDATGGITTTGAPGSAPPASRPAPPDGR